MRITVRLRSWNYGIGRRPRLPFAASPKLRAAQITSDKIFAHARCFPAEFWGALESYQPRLLVGSAVEFAKLAAEVTRGSLHLSSLDHAIFVLTRCGDAPLTDAQRLSLWRAFSVPAYEILLGSRSQFLGFECEAHEGLHLQPETKPSLRFGELVTAGSPGFRSGLGGSITETPCPCGRPGPRFINAHEYVPELVFLNRPVAPLAAIA